MGSWQPTAYKQYQWIVADPQLLGGKLAIRGTRALPEVLKVASEITDSFHVAA
jgi:uncharacterized protein (DUF433 family)